MKWSQITVEKALLILVLFLALAVRLYGLGAEPLSDGEAGKALQALSLARGQAGSIGADTGYITLTGLVFFLFSGSSFLARLWPALAGSLLVLAVFLFRRKLGAAATLILMIGLALDPGMVAISRLAGGSMLGLSFALLALGLAYNGLPVWAGIAAGLALLGGPGVIPGILGLVITWGISAVLLNARLVPDTEGPAPSAQPWLDRKGLLTALLTAGVTILFTATLFLRAPQGLAAWLTALPAYLAGWAAATDPLTGVPALRLASALAIYSPSALVFGLIGLVRGWLSGSRLTILLALWLIFAFVLALLYPSRQMGDLIWSLLPLWALASVELAKNLSATPNRQVVIAGLAVFIFLILALIWLDLAGMDKSLAILQGVNLRYGVLAGLVVLGLIATGLVGFGWSWRVARAGMTWGVYAALGLYAISMMWNSSHILFPGRLDLWEPVPTTQNTDLLVKTVRDLSEWHTGLGQSVDISLATDADSLRWALRDYPRLASISESQLAQGGGAPSIVITRKSQDTPAIQQLAQAYRGQDFALWTYPGWQGALPPDFLQWLTTHEAPLQQEQVILWARSDIFPSGEAQPGSTVPAQSPGAGEVP